LLLAGFISFIASFAINNIIVWSMPLFYMADTRQNRISKLKKAFQNPAVHLFLIFFFCQLAGLFYTSDIPQGWDRILSMFPLAFLPIVLISEPLSSNDQNWILRLLKFVIPTIFIGLLLFHMLAEGRTPDTFVYFSLVEGLGISQFYLAFILVIPLLGAFDGLQKKQFLIGNALIFLISLGLLVLLKNLTSLLFILILWIFLMIRFFAKTQHLKAALVILLGVLIFSFSIQLPLIQTRLQFLVKTTDFDIETIITKNQYTYTKNTLEHRFLIDYVALKTVQKTLPFGLGTGDVQEYLNEGYTAIGFKSGQKFHYNAHNQYLEELLKTGLIGLMSFVILLVYLCTKINLSDPYYPFILLFFITGCFFESYLNRQHGVFIFGFIIPYFLNFSMNRQREK
jgi:O-antigen ligase